MISREAAGSMMVVMSILFGLGLAALIVLRLVVFVLSRFVA